MASKCFLNICIFVYRLSDSVPYLKILSLIHKLTTSPYITNPNQKHETNETTFKIAKHA